MLPVHCLTRSISCRSAAYSPYNNVNLSFINFHERLRTSYSYPIFRHYRLASSAQQYLLFHYQRGHLEPYFPLLSSFFNLATLLFPISFSQPFFLKFLISFFFIPFSYFTSTLLLYSFSFHFSFVPFPFTLHFSLFYNSSPLCHFTNIFSFSLSLLFTRHSG